MSDTLDDVMESVRQEAEARARALQQLLHGADASRVFGPPVTGGGYTVIPAAEIASGGGLGSGMGFGRGPRPARGRAAGRPGESAETGSVSKDVDESSSQNGGGGGGGGGGGSMGRPVAAIVIGPDGVSVRPVLDVTKLVLTGLGVFTAVLAFTGRILRKK